MKNLQHVAGRFKFNYPDEATLDGIDSLTDNWIWNELWRPDGEPDLIDAVWNGRSMINAKLRSQFMPAFIGKS